MEMVEANWHWVKDGDLPDDRQEVYAVIKEHFYTTGKVWYRKEIVCFLNNYAEEIPHYIRKTTGIPDESGFGFMEQDHSTGVPQRVDVVCWCELPMIPKELREEM